MEGVLRDSGLQSPLEEFIRGESQHVIELEFLSGEQTIAVHPPEEGGTFEKSPGVLLLEGEEFTGGFSELGESEVDSPDFSLVLEAILADELEFVVDAFLLVGTTGSLIGGGV